MEIRQSFSNVLAFHEFMQVTWSFRKLPSSVLNDQPSAFSLDPNPETQTPSRAHRTMHPTLSAHPLTPDTWHLAALRDSTLTQLSAAYSRNVVTIAYCNGGRLPLGRAISVEFSSKLPTGGIWTCRIPALANSPPGSGRRKSKARSPQLPRVS